MSTPVLPAWSGGNDSMLALLREGRLQQVDLVEE